MKNKYLFYQANQCTGCQLCVMACSLIRSGRCGVKESLIKILTHPKFGSSMPIVSSACIETECGGECVQVCTPRSLKIADEKTSAKLLIHPNWQPVQIVPKVDLE